MEEMRVDGRNVFFQWMTWPLPDNTTEWQMRYASSDPNKFYCASVIAAYRELILKPEKKRNKIIAILRKAMKEKERG